MLTGGESYREELDEIIDYGEQTTSADNTEAEAETSDASKSEKQKARRKSRLPWSKDKEGNTSESKLNQIFSTSMANDKPNKLQKKKKRAKDPDRRISPAHTPA